MKREVRMTGGGPWHDEVFLIEESVLPVVACPYGQSTYTVQRQGPNGQLIAIWDGPGSR